MIESMLFLALVTVTAPSNTLSDAMYAPSQPRDVGGTCPAFTEGAWSRIQDVWIYRSDNLPIHTSGLKIPSDRPYFDFDLTTVIPGLRISNRSCSFEMDISGGTDLHPIHTNTRVVMLRPGAVRVVKVVFDGDVVTSTYSIFVLKSN